MAEDGQMTYIVEDPMKRGGGTRKISAEKFVNAYRGSGTWSTHIWFANHPRRVFQMSRMIAGLRLWEGENGLV